MDGPLDENYFQWLYGLVSLESPQTHWSLAKILFTKEYIWIVPNDDNRAEDGRALRREFCAETQIVADREWMELGCSMLEMLIALSRRLSFEADGEPRAWFWHFIHILGLSSYSDDVRMPKRRIDAILDSVIWRTYRFNGDGGLFPLKNPERDQRKVEIWYQLNAYLLEHL